ncbi:MAG TPA: 50S ribosomal protein L29 [Candidatus Binatia bacterium]|jgi:large subunit ribosomal protein L29
MQAKELRDLGDEELAQKRRELKEEIFHLKLRKATGRLENAMKIREDRRDLARIETIIKEKSKGGK